MRNDYLHAAVYATIGLAQARAHTNHDQAELTRGEHFERLFAGAIWHLHHDDPGWPTAEITARVMTSPNSKGWTDDQIAKQGSARTRCAVLSDAWSRRRHRRRRLRRCSRRH